METPVAGSRVAFAADKDKDGNWWVSVTHVSGGMQFTWVVPLDSADEVADGYAESIKETAKAARRERSGLVVANGSAFNHSNEAARRSRRN